MRGRGELRRSDGFKVCGKRESFAPLKLPSHFFKSESERTSAVRPTVFNSKKSRKQTGERLKVTRVCVNGCCLNGLMWRLLTYNYQIQQSFAALPLLQLSLDVDGLPGLPGAARCGS